ncbi:DNA cytosine methyltransferase [uncultured Mailhella sp.]|uniref:DNA cytosine methyltransferase n=1 Tax=uncultured Mailhella sp. TaxID=1981031 RepID=UPI00345BED88
MSAYYNEIDPFAAAWLRELIKAGHIAPGEVDTRSIEDVVPSDLAGFRQCHFFAGIGVWSYALRCAGWPDDRPVWTGSCPCQPFSAAGKRKGTSDERHLWPAFFHLISQCRPVTIFGEQVASRDGLAWFDLVSSDLEGAGYACGAVDTCAAGFGAPHIRQRLYWVAYADHELRYSGGENREGRRNESSNVRIVGRLGNPSFCGNGAFHRQSCTGVRSQKSTGGHGFSDGLGNTVRTGLEGLVGHVHGRSGRQKQDGSASTAGRNDGTMPTDVFWRNADWLLCRDGTWRPVEPGSCPLAHGTTSRVGRLRGYGNAIVAPQAEAFIRTFMDILR